MYVISCQTEPRMQGHKKAPCGQHGATNDNKLLLSIRKEIRPIWVFLVEDFLLLFRQLVWIVCKHIEDIHLVEREQPFTACFRVIDPPNHIG